MSTKWIAKIVMEYGLVTVTRRYWGEDGRIHFQVKHYQAKDQKKLARWVARLGTPSTATWQGTALK